MLVRSGAVPRRIRPASDPVEIVHDGARVEAQRGEPLAFALLAADRTPLARSPKLHRPRGPYCMHGGCEGCLARVDGVPNVMTCQRVAQGGEQIETQNVLGTRGVDALRAADFLFPKGIDHHRLFAGIRGVSGVVQSFARQVAGLGKLPEAEQPIRPGQEREVGVLVVGGGASGLATARLLGPRAFLVDDGPLPGGSQRALAPGAIASELEDTERAGAKLSLRSTAVGLFREPENPAGLLHAVVLTDERAILVHARAVVLATGTHDPQLPFGENDLPGVFSARAAAMLLQSGIAPGDRIALVGSGRFAEEVAGLAHAAGLALERFRADQVIRAIGRSKVSGIALRDPDSDGDGERREKVDAIVVDGPGAPALELAVQAGATARFHPEHGYTLVPEADGALGPGLFAVGTLLDGSGVTLSPESVAKLAAKWT